MTQQWKHAKLYNFEKNIFGFHVFKYKFEPKNFVRFNSPEHMAFWTPFGS